MAVNFTLNGKPASADVDPSTPILWTLRDTLGLPAGKRDSEWPCRT